MNIIIGRDGKVILQSNDPADAAKFDLLKEILKSVPGTTVTAGEIENHRAMTDEEHARLHNTQTDHSH